MPDFFPHIPLPHISLNPVDLLRAIGGAERDVGSAIASPIESLYSIPQDVAGAPVPKSDTTPAMDEGPALEKKLFTPPGNDPDAAAYNAYRQSVPGNADPIPWKDWKAMKAGDRPQAPPPPGSQPISMGDLAALIGGNQKSALDQLNALFGDDKFTTVKGLPKGVAGVYNTEAAKMGKAYQDIAAAQSQIPATQAITAVLRQAQLPKSALQAAQQGGANILSGITGSSAGTKTPGIP